MSKDKKDHYQPNGATVLVNEIIKHAVAIHASDIHLEPRQDDLAVRYRVDGLLQSGAAVPKSMMPSVIARVKVMVNIDIGEGRLPQDGKTHLNVVGTEFDLRVSTIPTIFGEKAVLRLLNKNHIMYSLKELGMEEGDLALFERMINRAQGLILVTGPTGSGKTTTLYSALNKINSLEKNIITIEDPVEYQLPNINQIQVNYKAGLTFAKGLRSILRQDPDVIMVGEIRDSETARIAVQGAMTGHLVFSTLHTNTAVSAVERLVDMGIEPYLVSSSLICVVAQRLLRLSCPKCEKCSYTGYKGRMGIYELLPVKEDIRKMINDGADKKQIEKAANIKTLFEAGLERVQKGLTTEEELHRVAAQDM